jgi:pimeloyl-ACP methyl ester carboxylesterase
MSTDIRNVVLVHGGFVDGSGWQGVHRLLTADGFSVTVVQNPTVSLEGDAEATRFILDGLDGPAVLVGHSYGGTVITQAGCHAVYVSQPGAVAGLIHQAAESAGR